MKQELAKMQYSIDLKRYRARVAVSLDQFDSLVCLIGVRSVFFWGGDYSSFALQHHAPTKEEKNIFPRRNMPRKGQTLSVLKGLVVEH